MAALLRIENLSVTFGEANRSKAAVRGVTLHVAGEVVGLLGESGSGKTTLASLALGLVPQGASVQSGAVLFDGADLLKMSERDVRKLRGSRIAMIPQEPRLAFNPVVRVGSQICEVIRAHRKLNSRQRSEAALAALAETGLREPQRIYDAFPHQLSGGQLQRAAIARAICCNPQLLIADEPTSSLDPASRDEILRLLKHLRAKMGVAVLVITHQPEILAGFADRIAVMLAGEIVECGEAQRVLARPSHPYTRELLSCQKMAGADDRLAPLVKHVSQVAEELEYAGQR